MAWSVFSGRKNSPSASAGNANPSKRLTSPAGPEILPQFRSESHFQRLGHLSGDDSVPNTPARKKQIRQDDHRRARNRWRKRIIKDRTKDFLDAITDRNVDAAETAFRAVQKELDRVSTTSTIHKNHAARRKSRLSRRLKDLKVSLAS